MRCTAKNLLLAAVLSAAAAGCQKEQTVDTLIKSLPRALEPRQISCSKSPLKTKPGNGDAVCIQTRLAWPSGEMMHVVYILPPGYLTSEKRYPALLFFAGLGESKLGSEGGARGYIEAYRGVAMLNRLYQPEGDHETVLDTADDGKAALRNAYKKALTEWPFKGFVIVCPYPPNVFTADDGMVSRYTDYIHQTVIPYSERHFRVDGRWSVDGISLGGTLSLLSGLTSPQRFTAVSSHQAALGRFLPRFKKDLKKHRTDLAKLSFNLVTSEGDFYLTKLTALHRFLKKSGIKHRFAVLPGKHDKEYIRNWGMLDMLLFHDWAFNGRTLPAFK